MVEVTPTNQDKSKLSRQSFLYDKYNNQTEVQETDFGTAPVPGSLLRKITSVFQTGGYDALNTEASTSPYLRRLPSSVSVFGGAGIQVSSVEYSYDETALTTRVSPSGYIAPQPVCSPGLSCRGNLTTRKRYINSNAFITETAEFDVLGNIVAFKDGRSLETSYDYTDSFAGSTSTLGNEKSFAYTTGITDAFSRKQTLEYDYFKGKVTKIQVPAGTNAAPDTSKNVTSIGYSDPLDRVTQVTKGVGSTDETQVTYQYSDTPNAFRITTTSDVLTLGDLKTEKVFDGLGRMSESRLYEDSTAYIATTQTYDSQGRPWKHSNPYRASDSVVYTETTYDELDRLKAVQTPDGAKTTYDYLTNQIESTDADGRVRRNVVDSLGRISSVVEDPSSLNYSTTYTYDASNNLRTVTQGSQPTREYTYDWLGRLISAYNPESGTVCYGMYEPKPPTEVCDAKYDGNGNLLYKTDALRLVTSMTYDSLNRLTGKTYSDTTPSVVYTWDTVRIGSLSSVANSAATISFSQYDRLGRVTQGSQTVPTGGQSYSFSYTYDKSSGLRTMTYPSGRVLTYTPDAAGRVGTLSGVFGSQSTSYASLVAIADPSLPSQKLHGYSPDGRMQRLTFGSGLIERTTFNNRLQPTAIQLGTASSASSVSGLNLYYCPSYALSCTSNNGNLRAQSISPLETLQDYTYDSLNRLKKASEGVAWTENFGYDRWGNMSVPSANGLPNMPNTPASDASFRLTNRLTDDLYDASGNRTYIAPYNLSYDAENRLISATSTTNGSNTYAYDGDGKRVQSVVSGVMTRFVYDAAGNLAAEYASQAGPGQVAGTRYLSVDQLGSTRVTTDGAGANVRRFDYLPFGEELLTSNRTSQLGYGAVGPKLRFTGKERDAETGLDYFGARYFSGAQGRFTSPDEWAGGIVDPFTGQQVSQPGPLPYADITDPQTLNKYAYVRNNPLRYVDPDGHCGLIGPGEICESFADFKASLSDRIIGGLKFLANGPAGNFGYEFKASNAEQQDAMNSAESAMPAASMAMAFIPGGKGGKSGARTEPTLPGKTIVAEEGVTVQHYTRSGDHGPAHLHVRGEGAETRIGQNGKPMKGDPPLSATQAQVVQQNKSTIRGAVDKIMRWFDYNRQQEGR